MSKALRAGVVSFSYSARILLETNGGPMVMNLGRIEGAQGLSRWVRATTDTDAKGSYEDVYQLFA
jgi:hypothetical protein